MIDKKISLAGGLYDLQSEYDRLCESEEVQRVLAMPDCELAVDFLGFIDDYRDLAGKLPDSITKVADLGCYAGIQSVYFCDKEYVGVDTMRIERRFNAENTHHIEASIQDYCRWVRESHLVNRDYKPVTENMFAFCCNVPNNDGEWDCVRDTFKYYRISYPNAGGKHYVEQKLPKEMMI